jgi:Flp pilus assembly CpaE family ATPase
MWNAMTEKSIKLLLVEDNPGDARLVREMVKQSDILFELQTSETLSGALALLTEGGFDSILLDLSLPDSRGIETLTAIRAHAPNVPVFVLTGSDDQALAVSALEHGAQDYLVKGQFTLESLSRNLRYGMARYKHVSEQKEGEKSTPLATIIGVVGAKGGCGASTIAVHLALELRRQTAQEVLLADLDVNGGTIGFVMQVARPYSMTHFLLNLSRMDATLYQSLVGKHASGVDVLQSPGSKGLGTQQEDEPVRQLLRFSRPLYSWIVIDMGRLNAISINLIADVGELLLVTTADILALYETRRIVEKLRELGRTKHLKLIMNRTSRTDVQVQELEKSIGVPVRAFCPDAPHQLRGAYEAGTLLPDGSPVRTQLASVAKELTGTGIESAQPLKRSFLGLRRRAG